MLILFDIDATLLVTGGAGIRAMVGAGKELFGPGFNAEGIEYAGRLDPLILNDMFRQSRIAPTEANFRAIRTRYREKLQQELAKSPEARVLPGVPTLVDRLRATEVTLGLLTGNFAETGCLKLRSCGLEPDHFRVQVWGDDSPKNPPARTDLPPVGMSRYEKMHGRALPAEHVTIIGDTPHDVACARMHGCRSLAVATGKFSETELKAAGADRAVRDLSDTQDLMRWLLD